jgi:hypothetical protein
MNQTLQEGSRRLPLLTACALTTLIIGEMPCQANDSPSVEPATLNNLVGATTKPSYKTRPVEALSPEASGDKARDANAIASDQPSESAYPSTHEVAPPEALLISRSVVTPLTTANSLPSSIAAPETVSPIGKQPKAIAASTTANSKHPLASIQRLSDVQRFWMSPQPETTKPETLNNNPQVPSENLGNRDRPSPDSTPSVTQDPAAETTAAPAPDVVQDIESRLRSLGEITNFGNVFQGSPAITIANPSGFGADNFTGFAGLTLQTRTRFSHKADGGAVIGIGLGDAHKAVGLELSYTIASFGTSRDFGAGGFNAKVHRQFPDDWAVAVGWNGFIGTSKNTDFDNSVYGTVTKVIRTRDDVNLPLSRIALTLGIGGGQFRSEQDVTQNRKTVGVFGSVAVRIAQPLSFITEWTGQDLALGFSIVPIKGLNWVITPAIRDIAGAGDGARFVISTGISFKF